MQGKEAAMMFLGRGAACLDLSVQVTLWTDGSHLQCGTGIGVQLWVQVGNLYTNAPASSLL